MTNHLKLRTCNLDRQIRFVLMKTSTPKRSRTFFHHLLSNNSNFPVLMVKSRTALCSNEDCNAQQQQHFSKVEHRRHRHHQRHHVLIRDEPKRHLFQDDLVPSAGHRNIRSRLCKAHMDVSQLGMEESFNVLKPSFLIFICKFDPFSLGLRRYTFSQRCKEGLHQGDRRRGAHGAHRRAVQEFLHVAGREAYA